MSKRTLWYALLTLSTILCLPQLAGAADTPSHATFHNVADMKLGPIPGLPTCLNGSVESGDPGKSASVIYAKAETNCAIPWHWHTPNEHVMLVTGEAHLEAKDEKMQTLKPGGFALLPAKHVHQFHCAKTCEMYLYADGAFDIHYQDKAGKEITPEEALKAVKETAATAPKTEPKTP